MVRTKLDLRKQKSQDALKKAFWQVLETSGYDKLSIKHVTDLSGLNRKTFYRNYESMESLIIAAFLDLFIELEKPYAPLAKKATFEADLFASCTQDYILNIKQEKKRLRLIFDNHLEGFAQTACKQLFQATAPFFVNTEGIPTNIFDNEREVDLYTNFLVFSSWGSLEWVLRHVDLPLDILLKETMDAFSTYLYNYYVSYRLGERFLHTV